MAEDDDADCVEHVWQLAGVALIPGQGATDYVCTRCAATLYVPAGQPMPNTI